MTQHNNFPDWFLWLWERGFVLLLIGGVLLLAALLAAGVYLEGRLDRIEGRLDNVPPPSFQPPNLDEYEAPDISAAQLKIHKSIYAPAYSHIYHTGGVPFPLETTLSIRNVDRDQAVYLRSVEYFDTQGKMVKSFIDRVLELAPLQTIEFLVERRNSSGGSGANFIVDWMGESGVDNPLVEAVMVGTAGPQAICFARTGLEISPSEAATPATD